MTELMPSLTVSEATASPRSTTKPTSRTERWCVRPSLSDIFRETLRGKSLQRTLQNVAGREILDTPLTGNVLDFAAGRHPGNYHRFLPQDDPSWISLDLNVKNEPHVIASMNTSMPFQDEAFDSVVFNNGIYIAEDPVFVLREIARILKPGGRLVLSVPSILEFIPEPHDYWRFTGEGLEKIMADAGLTPHRTVQMGAGRWSTIAYVLTPFLVPRILRAMVYGSAVYLDEFVTWVTAKLGKSMRVIPIGYVALAKKPGDCIDEP